VAQGSVDSVRDFTPDLFRRARAGRGEDTLESDSAGASYFLGQLYLSTNMNLKTTTGEVIVIFIICIYALISSAQIFKSGLQFISYDNEVYDDISIHDLMYSELLVDLNGNSMLGYFLCSNSDKESWSYISNLYLTQYSLAPNIITKSSDQDILLVKKHINAPACDLKSSQYTFLRNYGSGIYIFKKTNFR
jgi:hypothetical protein